jgi:tRNA threonylcarbamoyladenosine biosynthesis protein TsaE
MSAARAAIALPFRVLLVMNQHFTLELSDEAATLEAGRTFAKQLKPGLIIYLHGDLGAGKTTFVRGVLQGLGHEGKVKSPTYTLVEPYDFQGLPIYHFDLYRFADEYEWDAAGFSEYFNENSVCMVEWPEKAVHILPRPDFDVKLSLSEKDEEANGRILEIITH